MNINIDNYDIYMVIDRTIRKNNSSYSLLELHLKIYSFKPNYFSPISSEYNSSINYSYSYAPSDYYVGGEHFSCGNY